MHGFPFGTLRSGTIPEHYLNRDAINYTFKCVPKQALNYSSYQYTGNTTAKKLLAQFANDLQRKNKSFRMNDEACILN